MIRPRRRTGRLVATVFAALGIAAPCELAEAGGIANFSFPGASLSFADYGFLGEADGDHIGGSMASAGDVDGDGLDDILIGAVDNILNGSVAGKTYLFLGASLAGAPSPLDVAEADYIFVGLPDWDSNEGSVAGAGDVDGDGLDDILIGAAEHDDGGVDAGKTYLFLAQNLPPRPATLHLDIDEDYSFVGAADYDRSGIAVAGAGDVDGDGRADLLIGAHWAGASDEGTAHLFLAKNLPASPATLALDADEDYVFIGEAAGDDCGRSVASAGDVDGDGLDDILIAARYNDEGVSLAGKTYLLLAQNLPVAPASLDLGMQADYGFVGEYSSVSGRSVASAGDVDGDGLDDVLIGAPAANVGDHWYVGRSYLMLAGSLPTGPGPTTLYLGTDNDYTIHGEARFNKSGHSVAGVGDVDGDGHDDFAIGAYWNDDGAGSAGQTYLFLGANLPPGPAELLLGRDEDGSFLGETVIDYSGASVAGAGDVDGDGFDDILIGAFRSGESAPGAGKAYLIRGSPPAPPAPTLAISGTCPGVVHFEMAGFSSGGTIAAFGEGYLDEVVITDGPCAGFATSLPGPTRLATVSADATGAAIVSRSLSVPACREWIQAVDVDTCARTVAQRIP